MDRESYLINCLAHPERLVTPAEILVGKRELSVRGIYAWYGRSAPGIADQSGCHHHNGNVLLYVGIAPESEFGRSGATATRTIFNRLNAEILGYAHQSPIRKGVGCLLNVTPYHKPTPRKPLVFNAADDDLVSQWMQENVAIAGVQESEPWRYERRVIEALMPLLNREHNSAHPFSSALAERLSEFRSRAVAISGPMQRRKDRRRIII